MGDDCTFCRVVSGRLPSHRIYEDDHSIVFLDINPIRRGHVLLVPKKHYVDFLDIPESELTHLVNLVKKLAPALLKATDADGFSFIGNNGASAGQVVFHAHLHIIPRKTGEPRAKFSERFNWPQGREGDPDTAATAEAIRREL